jgi:NADPH:quinone reductase-like Zn-dependent oxidoreductase
MRTYRLMKIGSLDGLTMTEDEIPSPGLGEVLVKIRATSLNFRDLAILQGWMPLEFRMVECRYRVLPAK